MQVYLKSNRLALAIMCKIKGGSKQDIAYLIV